MKVGIFQPYFFPYLGYFQLISEVDVFVILDDVNFIKRGWINRNYIMINNSNFLFSLPVENISQFRKINEHFYVNNFSKFKKTMLINYKNKMNSDIMDDFLNIFNINNRVDLLNAESIFFINKILNIDTKIIFSSELGVVTSSGQSRTIEIVKRVGGSVYINSFNGRHLYDKKTFSDNGIELLFIRPNLDDFYPNGKLSMIDSIFTKDHTLIRRLLSNYILE